jgi:cytochrome P450
VDKTKRLLRNARIRQSYNPVENNRQRVFIPGEKWHRQRKLITPTFHSNILEQFAVVMIEKMKILEQCIALELGKNPQDPIDMFVLLTRCALDIMCGN